MQIEIAGPAPGRQLAAISLYGGEGGSRTRQGGNGEQWEGSERRLCL